jgi:hypothetical protein
MALDADTLKQLLDTVERFVEQRLRPLEFKVAEDDAIPAEIAGEMRDMGLFGISIPQEYGGLGLNMSEEAQVVTLLGRTSPAFRSLIGTNNGLGSQGLVMDGTDEQKQHWLPRLASGEIVGSFGLTEPEAGSDAGSVRTMARKDGDYYVINGTKRFITNAPRAGLFTVFARTDPNTKDARGVSALLVEAGTPGLSLGAIDKKMGQKGAHWDDPFLLDDQLTEDERMIRDTARAYAQDKLLPRVETPISTRHRSARSSTRWASSACSASRCRRNMAARRQLRRLRPRRARGRARRFRLSLDDERAVLAGDVSDLRLRLGGAAQEISAEARLRRMGRLLRPDRAGCRLRSRRHEDARREGAAAIASPARRCGSPTRRSPTSSSSGRSRAHGNEIRGFVLEKGMKGLSAPKIERQAVAARLDHRRDRDGRRRGARGARCCRTSPA